MTDLLSTLADLMTPSLRDHVANADYAQDVVAHRAAIDRICETRVIPACFDWVPAEVLELTRWIDPCKSDMDWGLPTPELHIMRAFCCTALLLQTEGNDFGVDSTLGNLTASLLAMDRAYLPMLAPVLDHVLNTEFLSDAEVALAHVLRLLIALERAEETGPILDAVLATESISRASSVPGKRRTVGFAGIKSVLAFNGWHVVARRIRELAAKMPDKNQAYFVDELAQQLLEIGPGRASRT